MKRIALTLLLPLVATMLQGRDPAGIEYDVATAQPAMPEASVQPFSEEAEAGYGAEHSAAASRIQRAWRNRSDIAAPNFEFFEKTEPSMSSKAYMGYLLDTEKYENKYAKKSPRNRRMKISYPKRKKLALRWKSSRRRDQLLMRAIARAHERFVMARTHGFSHSGATILKMTRGQFEAYSRAVQARLCDAFARLTNNPSAVISYEGGRSKMIKIRAPEGYDVDNLYELYSDLWNRMAPGVQEAFTEYIDALTRVSMKIKKRFNRLFDGRVTDVRMSNSRSDLSFDVAHQALIKKGMDEIVKEGFWKVYDNPMISGVSLDDIADQFEGYYKLPEVQDAMREMGEPEEGPVIDEVQAYGRKHFGGDETTDERRSPEDVTPEEMGHMIRHMNATDEGRDLLRRGIDSVVPDYMKQRAINDSLDNAAVMPHTMGF